MKHLSEKELAAHAMGHASAHAKMDTAQHLAACAACQQELDAWRQVLARASALPVPPAPDAAQVWQRVWQQAAPRAPQPRRRPSWGPSWRQGAIAAAAGVAVAATLWLARPHPAAPQRATAMVHAAARPSPVLRYVVAGHLDRTQALLVELAHANEMPGPAISLSLEKTSARNLLNANQLYRQSASLQGDAMMAHVLSALEPALLEIAHSPREVPPTAWRQMQQRIAASGVLFKVRVLDQTLHAQNGAL